MPAVTTATTHSARLCKKVWKRISSLLKNPANGGMPAIANVPTNMLTNVTGMYIFSPPIRRMSCSSSIAWMTEPLPRKSNALKNACVIR